MQISFNTGDTVFFLDGSMDSHTAEVIDIEGHRTASGEVVLSYLLSNQRFYGSADLFALQPEPKRTSTSRRAKALASFILIRRYIKWPRQATLRRLRRQMAG
ncbi:hypothetical protein [Spirosoma aerophilum]